MNLEVQEALVDKIERHIAAFSLQEFVCSFHGGEPLLFGTDRMRDLVKRLELVGQRSDCTMRYAITTNGTLLDEDWINILKDFNFSVTCSIDGPPEIHDARRVSLRGGDTWYAAVDGYLRLCRAGLSPAIIAVCDPLSDPVQVLDHLATDLGVKLCDVLMPDHNHTDLPPSVATYYTTLFNHWYDNYLSKGVEVRLLAEMVRGVLGLETRTDSIGYGPIETVSVNTDGALEPHDVLRIGGTAQVFTGLNIRTSELSAITSSMAWLSARNASLTLPTPCRSCQYKIACGGGHLGQRWSPSNGYDNPSVYCSDLLVILNHIASRLRKDIIPSEEFVPVRPEEE